MSLLGLLALLVFVSVVGRLAARSAENRVADLEPEPSPLMRGLAAARARRRPVCPQLPAGHRPPVGLGPLSPSERFLRTESARGLRELQIFLLEQKTP